MTVDLNTPTTNYSSYDYFTPSMSLDTTLFKFSTENAFCNAWSLSSSFTLDRTEKAPWSARGQLVIPKIVKATYRLNDIDKVLECNETLDIYCKKSFSRVYDRRTSRGFLLDDYKYRVIDNRRSDKLKKMKSKLRSASRLNLLVHLRRAFN